MQCYGLSEIGITKPSTNSYKYFISIVMAVPESIYFEFLAAERGTVVPVREN